MRPWADLRVIGREIGAIRALRIVWGGPSNDGGPSGRGARSAGMGRSYGTSNSTQSG
jgi:hypothetical protein